MPRVSGEAAEVARAEAQAVLSMVSDEGRRLTLADVVAAIDERVSEGVDADAPAEPLEPGVAPGPAGAVTPVQGTRSAIAKGGPGDPESITRARIRMQPGDDSFHASETLCVGAHNNTIIVFYRRVHSQ